VTSLMMAVERMRDRNQLGRGEPLRVRDLVARLQPEPRHSGTALLLKMLADGVQRRPFAVILCRFNDDPADAAREGPAETIFRDMFTPGSGGLVEYWREASLGMIDVTGSAVYGWLSVDMSRAAAGGVGREVLIDAAERAARAAGVNLDGAFRPIAVYTRNWSTDDPQRPPGTPNWTPMDPLKPWWNQWIDGSADGRGRICLTPPHNANITAHEMGHSLSMNHDVGPGLTTATDYYDPCCIMSQNNSFNHPRWGGSGPAVCLPHLDEQRWMFSGRVFTDTGSWITNGGITLPLAPISRPIARGNLGIKLSLRPELDWDYYVEYVLATGWNQGLTKPYVFIRRIVDIPGTGRRPAYLALMEAPTVPGTSSNVVEASGNTWFEATLTELPGPILQLTAQKR
jgi:hypothetical protein